MLSATIALPLLYLACFLGFGALAFQGIFLANGYHLLLFFWIVTIVDALPWKSSRPAAAALRAETEHIFPDSP